MSDKPLCPVCHDTGIVIYPAMPPARMNPRPAPCPQGCEPQYEVATDWQPVDVNRLAALEAENAELREVVEKLVSTPVFATRLDALLREAATLREHAKAVRRDIEKKLEDAHEMEERALELLRDAQTQVRREAAQTA